MSEILIFQYEMQVPSLKLARLVFHEALGMKINTDSKKKTEHGKFLITFQVNKNTLLICWVQDEDPFGLSYNIHLFASKKLIKNAHKILKDKKGFGNIFLKNPPNWWVYLTTISEPYSKKTKSVHIIPGT